MLKEVVFLYLIYAAPPQKRLYYKLRSGSHGKKEVLSSPQLFFFL